MFVPPPPLVVSSAQVLAGFAAHINLNGWQVGRWSVTLSLPPVCPTFEPSALPTRIVLFSPV
jgi:hypothetical protein